MLNKPLISVIVPFLNIDKAFNSFLISLKLQDYKNLEYIFVYDGISLDNESELKSYFDSKGVNGYSILYNRRKNLPSARNLGFNFSHGDWIISFDSDDILEKTLISKLYFLCQSENLDFCFCNFYRNKIKNSNGFVNQKYPYKIYNNLNFRNLFLKRNIKPVIPTTLFNSFFLRKNNLVFNENIKYGGDQYFLMCCANVNSKIGHLNEYLYNYVKTNDSIVTKPNIDNVRFSFYEIKNNFGSSKIKTDRFYFYKWSSGVLRSLAKNLSFTEFNKFSFDLNIIKPFTDLFFIYDFKAFFLILLFHTSKKFFYIINNHL